MSQLEVRNIYILTFRCSQTLVPTQKDTLSSNDLKICTVLFFCFCFVFDYLFVFVFVCFFTRCAFMLLESTFFKKKFPSFKLKFQKLFSTCLESKLEWKAHEILMFCCYNGTLVWGMF